MYDLLCRSLWPQKELVSLGCRVGTDIGCAGCRWVEERFNVKNIAVVPKFEVRLNCNSMVVIVIPCSCIRRVGLSFAYYSKQKHEVRTFGPTMWVWLPYYSSYLGNALDSSDIRGAFYTRTCSTRSLIIVVRADSSDSQNFMSSEFCALVFESWKSKF